jgi:hypothetical protein
VCLFFFFFFLAGGVSGTTQTQLVGGEGVP